MLFTHTLSYALVNIYIFNPVVKTNKKNDTEYGLAPLAQSVEHGSYEPGVAGSSPARSNIFFHVSRESVSGQCHVA